MIHAECEKRDMYSVYEGKYPINGIIEDNHNDEVEIYEEFKTIVKMYYQRDMLACKQAIIEVLNEMREQE